jgi:hypothetical protein
MPGLQAIGPVKENDAPKLACRSSPVKNKAYNLLGIHEMAAVEDTVK